MRILVVEDDPSIAIPLRDGLKREGFEVEVVGTGSEALTASPADVVLLDLGLPDLEGAVVCKRFRAVSKVPIVVVSARGEEIDRVTLLDLGADDYVVKPFGIRELAARIRAVTRRSAGPGRPDQGSEQISVGALHIDRRRRVVENDSQPVALTPKEYDLLVFLAADVGAVMGRDEIIRNVWDDNWWGSTKTLDVHIASLRKKLGPDLIETVRSVGYRLVEPPGINR